MGVIVAVLLLASLTVMSSQGSLPQPAIGDIKLVPYYGNSRNLQGQGYYEVLIYFSNGVDQPGYGGFCADNSYSEEASVICNQLGYAHANFTYGDTDSSVWLKEVICDKNDLHILRCQYRVAVGSERTNTNTCGPRPNKLLIKCDKPLPPYNGKLAFCPDDNATDDPNVRQSVSFGIVSLYLESHNTWRGLETKTQLGATEANTICRQMGFTGAVPGSAVALSASDHTFKKCFGNTDSELPFRLIPEAWMTTDVIKCPGPQQCFGCCYSYPTEDASKHRNLNHSLIISCTFDPTAKILNTGSPGSENDCQLNSVNQVTHCVSDNSQEVITHLKIAFGIVAAFLALLGPCGSCCFCYYYNKYKHHCDHCNYLHRIREKVMCCMDYTRIGQRVDNNRQILLINQSQNQIINQSQNQIT